jgi:hypothetical protein
MKKKHIQELIDSDGNLIGNEDVPMNVSNEKTAANRSTDHNAKVSHQNFKNDFLGRFGFYFYESEDDAKKLQKDLEMVMYDKFLETLKHYHENPDKLNTDYKKHFEDDKKKEEMLDDTDAKWADKIMDLIEPHMKKKLNEDVIKEDKLTKKKVEKMVKKSEDEMVKKVKDMASLLKKLPKNEYDQLMKLLEK